jgi:hypothetical protein
VIAIVAGAILGCADLEQAATGDGPGTDESTGASAASEPSPSTSGDAPGDDTQGSGGGTTSTASTTAAEDDSGATVALDDTSTGDPTGEPGSTDDGMGPLPGPHDGSYVGLVTAQFTVDGQNGSCQGPLNLVVDDLGAPQISGSGSCTAMIGPYPFDVAMTVDGTIASPSGSGTINSVINFENESTTWTGSFAGDVLTATFAGDFPQGPYVVTYTGSWSVTR